MVTVTDLFTRGDEALAANANWESGDGAYGIMQLVSNAVEADATGTDVEGRWVGTALADDHQSTITIDHSNLQSQWQWVGALARVAANGDSYNGYHVINGSGIDRFYIYFIEGGSGFTELAGPTDIDIAWVNGDSVTFDVVSNALEVFHNGVSIDSTTHSTLTTGSVGITCFTNAVYSLSDIRILDFTATDGVADTSFLQRPQNTLVRM